MASDTAIMESFEPFIKEEKEGRFLAQDKLCAPMASSHHSKTSLPDVLTGELTSLNLHGGADDKKSFLLIDQMERLTIDSDTVFCSLLKCHTNTNVKVVSILGNTGEGKSYTLNHTFFDGEDVFPTSSHQDSCTTGVWAAYDSQLQAVVLDTEGMLGMANNENLRTRMLLKVLAVSDIVIYKTRAERLHNDMFYFLGDASKSYARHFSAELDKLNKENRLNKSLENENVSSLGPSVIVFHETVYTDPLGEHDPEGALRNRLTNMDQDISAFSKLKYVGSRMDPTSPTNSTNNPNSSSSFTQLREVIRRELLDNTVRSARKLSHVYKAFSCLNNKFSGNVSPGQRSFPDQYFTCQSTCQSCGVRCCGQMRHAGDHTVDSDVACAYSVQLENKVYSCKRCQENGRRCVVVPKASSSKEGSWVGLAKFAWSGYVLECQRCGVIYRSRQHWIGNQDPELQGVVSTTVAHVWPGVRSLQGTQNAARRLLDGVSAISGSVTEVSGAPAVSLARWAADQVAPAYWRPNADIVNCHSCSKRFTATCKIHHCRACGEGFCDACSNFKRQVPEKGWGFQPVRVCKICHMVGDENTFSKPRSDAEPKEVQVRKVGETVIGTVSSLANTLEIPISLIKDSARPEYWVPDHEINSCSVCDRSIGPRAPVSQESTSVHHCRQCGQGVCNKCSLTRRPVISRGWDMPVRVCDDCIMMPEESSS